MPSKQKLQTRLTSLSDQESCELLTATLTGRGDRGQNRGAKFRASVHALDVTNISHPKHPAWSAPNEQSRLPIDDNLFELISRNQLPRIAEHRARNSDSLNAYGPYFLARLGIFNAALRAAAVSDTKARAVAMAGILKDIAYVEGQLLQIISSFDQTLSEGAASPMPQANMWSEISNHLSKYAEQSLEDRARVANSFHCSRQHMVQIIDHLNGFRENLPDIPLLAWANAPNSGRPKNFWIVWFVAELAKLWQLLTLEEPVGSEDGLFGRFVSAAWLSLDDNMPEVSFARAIKVVSERYKKDRG